MFLERAVSSIIGKYILSNFKHIIEIILEKAGIHNNGNSIIKTTNKGNRNTAKTILFNILFAERIVIITNNQIPNTFNPKPIIYVKAIKRILKYDIKLETGVL